MSSEMAGKIAVSMTSEVFPTRAQVAKYVDAQLQEVRTVLTNLAYRTNVDEDGHCWCTKNLTDDSEPHDKPCQQARILWQRLTPSVIKVEAKAS